MKIGYMGIPNSFSEIAAKKLVEQNNLEDSELLPMVCAENIKAALLEKQLDYGILATYNSTVGPVSEFVKAFRETRYTLIDTYILPIHHCLFKHPDVPISELHYVASHPQALKQTLENRKKYWPQLQEVQIDDTAIGARYLIDGTISSDTAVICSHLAGEFFNLELLQKNIEDSSKNKTTFILLKL